MHTMRRIALVLITCVVASLAVLAALIIWLGPAFGIAIGLSLATGVVATYVAVLGPWQRRWGASDEEVRGAMPGDDLLRPGAPSTTRAITIDAGPRDVFPWLLQIGYGRGGWYSYDWIDNDGRRSVDRIVPSLQNLAVGDRIQMIPGSGPSVREIEPDHHILSGGEADTWCLLVEPRPKGEAVSSADGDRIGRRASARSSGLSISDPGAFVMERKMLRTIRDLAEGHRVDRIESEGGAPAPSSASDGAGGPGRPGSSGRGQASHPILPSG